MSADRRLDLADCPASGARQSFVHFVRELGSESYRVLSTAEDIVTLVYREEIQTPDFEERCRVFWSLFWLNVSCAIEILWEDFTALIVRNCLSDEVKIFVRELNAIRGNGVGAI